MPNIDLSILNQRQTPAFFADTLANRPAAGFLGRIFVSTDTYAFYRDNGTGWDLIGGPGTGTITGSGATNQVAFWNGASSITGENNLWWDSVNNHFGINTNAPGTALDIHHDQSTMLQLNQTTATNDSRIAFQNSGTALWRIGNFYNAGANDWGINDVVGAIQPLTIKKTTGQTFIGAETTTSGRLVVNNATGDNHIVVIGATAPSIRINNAGSGATRQIGIGLATTTNNFIQGTTGGELCLFNSSTTASPILFGIYSTGLGNTQEAARISPSRNFLIGGVSTDTGQRLQVTGNSYFSGNIGINTTTTTNKLTINSVAGGFTTIASISENSIGNSPTAILLQNSSATESANTGINIDFAGSVNWLGRIQSKFVGSTGAGNTDMSFYTASSGSLIPQLTIASTGAATFSSSGSFGTTLGIAGGIPSGSNVLAANGSAIFTGGLTAGTNITLGSGFNLTWGGNYGANIPTLIGLSGASGYITFYPSGSTNGEAARFTNSNNFLIGTTTDTGEKLQVAGNVSATNNTNGDVRIFANNQNSGGAARSFVYASTTGNRYIGLLSYGASAAGTICGLSAASLQVLEAGSDANALLIQTGISSVPLVFGTNNVERMRIKSTGVINISGIPTSAAGLVSGDIYSNAGILTIVP